MELASSIIGVFPCLWDGSATQVNYLRKLKKNLKSLRTSLDKLKELKDDVKKRVDDAEENPIMKRTRVVGGWLQRVESLELEVAEILQEGTQQLEACTVLTGCFCCCCLKNCCTGYKLGKLVVQKLASVEELRNEGVFSDVVDRSNSVLVQEIPTNQVVGMDSQLDEIWRLVTQEDQIRIIGLYGMGGVGKTTLLKKLNNEFLKKNRHDFDLVVWVVVSKDLNLQKVQKDIADSVGLSWSGDQRDLNRGAKEIFNVLSKKKFVLLLDDIWQRVDLLSLGIPPLHTSSSTQGVTKSKVVFTTRSEFVCGLMEADKKIRVECLNWDQAWSLFQNKVGKEALNSHPKVPKLAELVAKECRGLPLALITIGRTMATKKTPQEWEHAITVLTRSASDFSGMGDEVLPILKFSYDNLQNDKFKSCFLYCSLYPEDYKIGKEELIDLWIGEGFLTEFDDIEEARNDGHYVIGCLLGACLLESVDDIIREPAGVKMHDVIRDLAIWVASDYGRKKERQVFGK
ncbi:Disease resistance protein [Macleaya cordata]|uniref:Disease resistance protein n=1 Tax=Macleaya cordata TaxID=56857 RepID=A0A200QBU1_MACCD|nr:Disease resistance protein [Macleaya cordata]